MITPPGRTFLSAIAEVFGYVSAARRRQLGPVLLLMLVGAFAEVASIGAILPFLALIADPDKAADGPLLHPIVSLLNLRGPTQIIAAATVLLIVAMTVAMIIRLALVRVSQNFVFGVSQELSVALYRRTLHQPYAFHTGRNTSETLAVVNRVQQLTGGLFVPLMQAATAIVIAIFILVGLLIINPLVAIVSGVGFGAIYLIVMRLSRRILMRGGKVISRAQVDRLQAVTEGLGGIRDVLLDHSQEVFIRRYADVEANLRKAQASISFISTAPRFVVEAFGGMLIAIIAVILTIGGGGAVASLPVLGALALGAQRLLPLLQQIYQGWTSLAGGQQMLGDTLAVLRLPEAAQFAGDRVRRLPFEQSITLEDVEFTYPQGARPALEGVSLVIPRGVRMGFAGKTGSGKSTLMDIVLGLLTPDSGRISIDGVALDDTNRSAWQAQIAHVPQFIYLADASIAENIAFGVPLSQIDRERVQRAAAQAELLDVVEALPARYDTVVGERGVRLSGGQRQRIGIARALYKDAQVLVFDEATSALDHDTESAVMASIGRLGRHLTLLIIAHRLSTLEGCDTIVRLEQGHVAETAAGAKAIAVPAKAKRAASTRSRMRAIGK